MPADLKKKKGRKTKMYIPASLVTAMCWQFKLVPQYETVPVFSAESGSVAFGDPTRSLSKSGCNRMTFI